MAGLNAGENLRMRQIGARCVTGRRIGVEDERSAFVDRHRPADKGAEPQLRSLQIDQNADRTAACFLDGADRRHQFAHAVLAGVAHIDAKHVDAGDEQSLDHLRIGRGRSEGGDDFGAALASHRLPPCAGGGTDTCDGFKRDPAGPSEGRGGSGRSGACSAVSVSCTVQDRCSPVSTSK